MSNIARIGYDGCNVLAEDEATSDVAVDDDMRGPGHGRGAGTCLAWVRDVLAGWVLGGTWMVCTVLIMDSMARWRGAPAALARQ